MGSSPLSFWCSLAATEGLTPLGLEELAQTGEEISQLYWILDEHWTDGAVGHEWGVQDMLQHQGQVPALAVYRHGKTGFWLTSPVFLCSAVKKKTKTSQNQNQTKNNKTNQD